MEKNDLGVIGLAVMGQNLARNFASHGYSVAVFNRSEEKTTNFINSLCDKSNLHPYYSLEDFTASLSSPKKIMLMVKAGEVVDKMIESLLPYLEEGDLIIDGGNSYYEDTVEREKKLKQKGIYFLGTGISGGEEGALNGASIMPGGDIEAFRMAEPFLKAAAAIAGNEEACTCYIGPNGAGHFVKTTHNGIEYADMQLICEAYSIMRDVLNMQPDEISSVFSSWNTGELNSYLIEITANIFKKKDEITGDALVNKILDRAGQKGTGIWTSLSALKLGVCSPTITEAVYARVMSSRRDERLKFTGLMGKQLPESCEIDKKRVIQEIKDALYLSKICAYAQGFSIMRTASIQYGWSLDLAKIALIWRGGCIIRAQFLNCISDAFLKNPELENILFDDYFLDSAKRCEGSLRSIVSLCAKHRVSVPCFSSALSYLDGLNTKSLPANLLQAQRDYFGAHTYERTDKEGTFHTEWTK